MIEAWLQQIGFVWSAESSRWCVAWDCRSGFDFTDLEFCRVTPSGDYADKWYALVGHHASGTNPRIAIGICESLEDVQRTYEAIRLINGHPGPVEAGR